MWRFKYQLDLLHGLMSAAVVLNIIAAVSTVTLTLWYTRCHDPYDGNTMPHSVARRIFSTTVGFGGAATSIASATLAIVAIAALQPSIEDKWPEEVKHRHTGLDGSSLPWFVLAASLLHIARAFAAHAIVYYIRSKKGYV